MVDAERRASVMASVAALFILAALGLNGCIGSTSSRSRAVAPGALYPGRYINVTATSSQGWRLYEDLRTEAESFLQGVQTTE